MFLINLIRNEIVISYNDGGMVGQIEVTINA